MSHMEHISFLISNDKQHISNIKRFEIVKGQYVVKSQEKQYSTKLN